MRTLTDHKINGLNDQIEIQVLDEPGQGGASHEYQLVLIPSDNGPLKKVQISFQNGPVKETGFNGFSQEALLAIVIDRLRSFQSGPFSTKDNAVALTHIETALLWLHKRTRERLARGVEGTNQK